MARNSSDASEIDGLVYIHGQMIESGWFT